MRVDTFVVGAWLLGVALSAGPGTAQDANLDRLTAAQRELADLKGARNDISLRLTLDRPSATYQIGDPLAFSVQASDDVYLTILNVGARGNVTLLLPNAAQPDNRVHARQPFSVPPPEAPYVIRVSGPAGFELIKVIATKKPIDVNPVDFVTTSGPLRSLRRNADELSRDLGGDLERRLAGAYSVVEVVIHVIDK